MVTGARFVRVERMSLSKSVIWTQTTSVVTSRPLSYSTNPTCETLLLLGFGIVFSKDDWLFASPDTVCQSSRKLPAKAES